jgi:signal transduction histidine kinase
MFAELLAEGRVPDPAKQKSYLQIISAEGARLTRLINNVLDFARIERGDKKYNLERCDLSALVRETAEAYRPHLESNGFEFKCSLPNTILNINADRDAVAQVLVNLLSNAEKYSNGQKGIGLHVESHESPALRGCSRLDGKLESRGLRRKDFREIYRATPSAAAFISSGWA